METRKEAALRKLREECGLVGEWVKDIGTFDVIMNEGNNPSHGITTVSLLKVAETKVQMDQQSLAYAWRSPNEWMEIVESDFVRMIFEKYILEANEQ